MKKSQLLFALPAFVLLSAILFNACSKGGNDAPSTPPNPCQGVNITVTATATDADAGASNGSITATATGSTGLTFSLNNGASQASGTFSNLAAGAYTIVAKNSNGCSGSASVTVNAKDACAGKTITLTGAVGKNSDPCTPSGAVTLTAGGSTGFTYNVDNGTYQASSSFSNVAAGNHTFGAKDAGGCVKTAAVAVPAAPAGPFFTAVKAVINTNCAVSGCHNGTQAPNYTDDCNIVAFADLIKQRAVDQAGTATQMPQPPRAPLVQADRDKITAWIAAGKHYTD